MDQHTIDTPRGRLGAAGGLAALALLLGPVMPASAGNGPDAALAVIAPGEARYTPTEEALMNGKPVAPDRVTVAFNKPLKVMQRLVSQAEYAECVQAKGCRPLDKPLRGNVSPDLPVVGVSWQDATDYARWYSGRTGHKYRLPTYAEWVHAAGEVFKDAVRLDIDDPDNPARRWLIEYELETQRKAVLDGKPKPFGTFGANAAGLQDIGGNVWEWTDTCQTRRYLDQDRKDVLPPNENCGVRVVAGSHYSLITDFIRDPKSGACSVGIPPANLGIRLVRED